MNESKLAVVRLLQLFSFGVDNDFTIRQSEEDVVDDGVIIDRWLNWKQKKTVSWTKKPLLTVLKNYMQINKERMF